MVGGSGTPCPDRAIVNGSAWMSLTRLNSAAWDPTMDGSNLTAIEQGSPVVIEVSEQVSAVISNESVSVPVISTPSSARSRAWSVLNGELLRRSSARRPVRPRRSPCWPAQTAGSGPGGRLCSVATVVRSSVAVSVLSAPSAMPPPGALKYWIRLTEKLLGGSDGVESQGSELCMFPASEVVFDHHPARSVGERIAGALVGDVGGGVVLVVLAQVEARRVRVEEGDHVGRCPGVH